MGAFEPTYFFRRASGGNSQNGDHGQDNPQAEAIASDENYPIVGFVERESAQQQYERPGCRHPPAYHAYGEKLPTTEIRGRAVMVMAVGMIVCVWVNVWGGMNVFPAFRSQKNR